MGCGIYKITNKIDNKVYIGSSLNLSSREYKHFWMLNKNIHDNSHLQNAYNKYGKENFIFEIVKSCPDKNLVEFENYYINFYKSNLSDYGYNLAVVNDSRRNSFNDEVKNKLSLYNLKKNGNFKLYSLTNILTNEEFLFETLVDGANYLIKNGFTNGKPRNVRMTISNSLREKKINNGNPNGTIRKTIFKHKSKIIN